MIRLKTNSALVMIVLITMTHVSCISEKEPIPEDCNNPPGIELVSVSEADCNQPNGRITVMGFGGEGALHFRLGDSQTQVSTTFEGLMAGLYTAIVEDELGCISTLEVEVLNRNGLNIEVTSTATICGENQGEIVVIPLNPNGRVEYKLNDGQFQDSNSFNNLDQGEYMVTARDESGCQVSYEVQVESDITFNEVNLIIQSDCAIPNCHDGGALPDYRGESNIIGNAALIKQRTQDRTMPPDGRMISQEQIGAIACWVEDGAKGN